jgi:hypothetical protein
VRPHGRTRPLSPASLLSYGWLFRDARSGTSAQQFASLRRLASLPLAAAIYVPAVLTLPFQLVAALCWARLRLR